MEMIDLTAYLARIGISHDGNEIKQTESLAFLTLLVKQHQLAFPFENLAACGVFPVQSAHVNDVKTERISIDASNIFQKLVIDRRGGYCFEQNALFTAILRVYGYKVETLSARVAIPSTMEPGAPPSSYELTSLSHMILIVALHGSSDRYLCDVGFGGRGQPPFPLKLQNYNTPATTEHGEAYELRRVNTVRGPLHDSFSGDFRMSNEPVEINDINSSWALYYRTKKDGEFFPSYVFSTVHAMGHVDYVNSNWYCSTHPQSIFTRGAMCVKRTPVGLKTLQGMKYKSIQHGEAIDSREIQNEEELLALLKVEFGLELPM